MSGSQPFARTIGRSFDAYYRDTARVERMNRLNAMFVGAGSLVFDVGAHVGDRTGSVLQLGARVVALEPQPKLFRVLRRLYRHCEHATLLPLAAGGSAGEIDLHLNTANPTVATVSPAFIDAAQGAQGWNGEVWDQTIPVRVTTLDALVDEYGVPDFIKIDVEGHEPEVLAGLSRPVAALSFEFTLIQRAAAHRCLQRLAELGTYEFNLSLGEEHALRFDQWLDGPAMSAVLDSLPDAANSGDVYARRI